jgi:predicted nucleotide-binding protein (sugar kinase/HSP70/actin superfamily)
MSEFTNKIIKIEKDIEELKKNYSELAKLTEVLKKVKFEGHGKIIVAGVEFKINENTNLNAIVNRISKLENSGS